MEVAIKHPLTKKSDDRERALAKFDVNETRRLLRLAPRHTLPFCGAKSFPASHNSEPSHGNN